MVGILTRRKYIQQGAGFSYDSFYDLVSFEFFKKSFERKKNGEESFLKRIFIRFNIYTFKKRNLLNYPNCIVSSTMNLFLQFLELIIKESIPHKENLYILYVVPSKVSFILLIQESIIEKNPS